MTIYFMVLYFLTSGFIQKWYFPQGLASGTSAVIQIVDTNRDNNLEFIFTRWAPGPFYLYFYELHLPDVWEVDSLLIPYYHGLYDSGDFDNDGLYDFVLMFHSESPSLADGITVFESPDSFSYPTQEVWRDTVGQALVTPICVHDIDLDGLTEVVKVTGDFIDLHIYESVGSNIYDKIAEITTASTHTASSTLAFGDFDLDGRNEFVWGYSGGEYSIFECIGDNSYQEIALQQIPIPSGIKDCFTVPDADGDGRLEFVLKGHVLSIANVNTYIFEAVGDNTYQIIKSFILPGGSNDYYGGYSDAGDVDGDSVPEIVLEACQNVYIIKSAGNDSFYIWDTLPGHLTGSNVRVTNDIDGNGLNEIVISGNNQTRIYEYEPGGIEEGKLGDLPLCTQFGTIAPNPFSGAVRIPYQVACAGDVKLGVYDVSGRLICRLASGVHEPGFYQIIWNGNDQTGRKVAQGIYFIRVDNLETGESSVQKVLKVK